MEPEIAGLPMSPLASKYPSPSRLDMRPDASTSTASTVTIVHEAGGRRNRSPRGRIIGPPDLGGSSYCTWRRAHGSTPAPGVRTRRPHLLTAPSVLPHPPPKE